MTGVAGPRTISAAPLNPVFGSQIAPNLVDTVDSGTPTVSASNQVYAGAVLRSARSATDALFGLNGRGRTSGNANGSFGSDTTNLDMVWSRSGEVVNRGSQPNAVASISGVAKPDNNLLPTIVDSSIFEEPGQEVSGDRFERGWLFADSIDLNVNAMLAAVASAMGVGAVVVEEGQREKAKKASVAARKSQAYGW
jgi:hypothetical protein